MHTINRRRHERFALQPMYTRIRVQLPDSASSIEGHAYDISEGGVRFDLDQPIPPGSAVTLQITLPGPSMDDGSREVFAHANVIWVNEDPDEPGPVRMAAAFTRFARSGDHERLLNQLSSGRFARAA